MRPELIWCLCGAIRPTPDSPAVRQPREFSSSPTRTPHSKAYLQTRGRYLGGLPQRRAFNQIGEVLPSVIIDGVLAGTWSWNARNASIDVDLIAGTLPASVRRQVNARASALTETLRSAWAPRPSSRRTTDCRTPLLAATSSGD
jgi:hypothetical protein